LEKILIALLKALRYGTIGLRKIIFVFDEVRNRWFMFVRPRAYAGEGVKGCKPTDGSAV